MKYFNFLYIALALVASGLYLIQKNHNKSVISFFGYTENKETEINFNYPVQVDKIHVTSGQLLAKDMKILDVTRVDNKQIIQDQPYKIEKIQAEKRAWVSKLNGQIELLKNQKSSALAQLQQQKEALKEENTFKLSLYDKLESVSPPRNIDVQLESDLKALDREYQSMSSLYDEKIQNKKNELTTGLRPYDSEINRLNYQMEKQTEHASVDIPVLTTEECLIGNIYCKENEHFTSYKTLLSVYEPSPSMIKGFIHEDFITEISLGDFISVQSTKDELIEYRGTVTGLGSRVVEIPSRLRKRPDIKTYGREIVVSIPIDNKFLQKEKVVLELITTEGE